MPNTQEESFIATSNLRTSSLPTAVMFCFASSGASQLDEWMKAMLHRLWAPGIGGQCPAGIAASERTIVPKTMVQEVASDKAGVRVFVVHSEERMAFECARRQAAMQRVLGELRALEKRVIEGKLKAPGIDISSQEAWEILKTVRVVEFTLSEGQIASLRLPGQEVDLFSKGIDVFGEEARVENCQAVGLDDVAQGAHAA